MKKAIRITIIILLLGVFAFGGYNLYTNLHEYKVGEDTYTETADICVEENESTVEPEQITEIITEAANQQQTVTEYITKHLNETESDATIRAPITVDFDEMKAVNEDVVGWIYCDDTIINYPVVRGDDNSYYLKHLINGKYNKDGTIFVDVTNNGDFSDYNTLVYGHNMKDGQMFAELLNYESQSYYEEHKVMWLLTPTQNYMILPFAGYTTTATSETYTIFYGYDENTQNYIDESIQKSDFQSDYTPQEGDKMVVLSTCSYSFDDARYVVHGVLVPISG